MTETSLTQVRDWLEGLFDAEGPYTSCYLVDLTLSGTKLAVFIDCDEGLSLKTCQEISRFLEERIESHALLPEKYTLEVSSPGLDRPLMLPRQYIKNIGRSLRVHLIDDEDGGNGEQVKGKLVAADGQAVRLEYEEVHREGKKKQKVTVTRDIPFSSIEKSFVLISFK